MFSSFMRRPSSAAEEGTGSATSSTSRPPSGSSSTNLGGRGSRMTLSRSHTRSMAVRPVCRYGVECRRRNPEHLKEMAHPADDDYLECCRAAGTSPEFINIQRLFEWADHNGSGKISKSDMEEVWPVIQGLGKDVASWNTAAWERLDDDGNGYLNFSEFVDAVRGLGVDLLLSADEVFATPGEANLCCGVVDCGCKEFRPRRRRCKYGSECFQKSPSHLRDFCHPCDEDWKDSKEFSDPNMCQCGHKKKLHQGALTGGGDVRPPGYWVSKPRGDGEFQDLVTIEEPEIISRFQDLFDRTYSDVTTRDRCKHNGNDWRVPKDFTVISAVRNENSKLWLKYTFRKAFQQKERKLADELGACADTHAHDLPPFQEHTDVLTTSYWEERHGTDKLDARVNEWYLWHGTSAAAADHICKNDFKLRLAGTATGSLYGPGSYFAESITKADEYSRTEGGTNTVLLCRVLGGRVRYCDERSPDADQLTSDCVEGPYDSILGDRVKTSNTYREFIIFDTEDVYPEYIITYRRGALFKSPSHP